MLFIESIIHWPANQLLTLHQEKYFAFICILQWMPEIWWMLMSTGEFWQLQTKISSVQKVTDMLMNANNWEIYTVCLLPTLNENFSFYWVRDTGDLQAQYSESKIHFYKQAVWPLTMSLKKVMGTSNNPQFSAPLLWTKIDMILRNPWMEFVSIFMEQWQPHEALFRAET